MYARDFRFGLRSRRSAPPQQDGLVTPAWAGQVPRAACGCGPRLPVPPAVHLPCCWAGRAGVRACVYNLNEQTFHLWVWHISRTRPFSNEGA